MKIYGQIPDSLIYIKDMPIKKVKGGYKWGSKGKVYKSKVGAKRQARAAYASGYKRK